VPCVDQYAKKIEKKENKMNPFAKLLAWLVAAMMVVTIIVAVGLLAFPANAHSACNVAWSSHGHSGHGRGK
jgi:hypothetical protein